MEEQQQNQPNKYITFLKKYRYNAYFIGAIALLFILIIGMIVLIASSSDKKSAITPSSKNTQPSSDGSVSTSPSSLPVNLPIITPDPTQATVIQNQVAPQITPNVGVSYTVPSITLYGNDWAVMVIANPNTDNARVILKKENGAWKAIMGPGTAFSPEDLQSIGAPQQLIENLTQPAISPSSSESNDIQ